MKTNNINNIYMYIKSLDIYNKAYIYENKKNFLIKKNKKLV